MIWIAKTQFSTYELDDGCEAGEENPIVRVRRLEGVAAPTPRQGPDGEWKDLAVPIDPAQVHPGQSLLFVWRFEDGVGKSTLSSTIASIQPADQ